MYNVCIIGGGASGLVTAISLAMENSNKKICIIEKKESIGKKLLATGNGRCNISNLNCNEVDMVKDFFSKIGVVIKAENDGKMYPYSEQAKDVLAAIQLQLEKYNIHVIVNYNVENVSIDEKGFFQVDHIKCSNLVIATGGKAAPNFGSTGDGYRFAKTLGHSYSKLRPVLTPIETVGVEKLKGIRVKGTASLLCRGKLIAEEKGEIQFIEGGVSGICIFNLSRYIRLDEATKFDDYEISINLVLTLDNVKETVRLQRQAIKNNYLTSMVPNELGQKIIKKSKEENIPVEDILKDFRLKVTGAKGWQWAQCTGGGITLEEINTDTMESKIVKKLYLVGEVLDYDGPCGGYNLQNAWITGIKAGRNLSHV